MRLGLEASKGLFHWATDQETDGWKPGGGGGVEIRTDTSDLCQVNQDPPSRCEGRVKPGARDDVSDR